MNFRWLVIPQAGLVSRRPVDRETSVPRRGHRRRSWAVRLLTLPSPKSKVFFSSWFNPSGCFQKLGIPQNGWFIMENPIEMDDLGVPLFKHPSEKNPVKLNHFTK